MKQLDGFASLLLRFCFAYAALLRCLQAVRDWRIVGAPGITPQVEELPRVKERPRMEASRRSATIWLERA